MLFLALLSWLYYSTVNREAVSRVGNYWPLTHIIYFNAQKMLHSRKLSYKQSASVVFKSGRLKTLK